MGEQVKPRQGEGDLLSELVCIVQRGATKIRQQVVFDERGHRPRGVGDLGPPFEHVPGTWQRTHWMIVEARAWWRMPSLEEVEGMRHHTSHQPSRRWVGCADSAWEDDPPYGGDDPKESE